MPTFVVQAKGSRLVRETVYVKVEVSTYGLGGVEGAVRDALARGDFEETDCECQTENAPVTLTEVTSIERTDDPAPAPAPTPAQPYRAAAGGQGYQPTQGGTGASGVAVARVETRPNGYSPARVRHVPAGR